MVLDDGTTLAIMIALLGSITVMCLFWKENINQHKQIRHLQAALRDERKKNAG